MLTTRQSSCPFIWTPSLSSCRQMGGGRVASKVPFQRNPGVSLTGRPKRRLPMGGTAYGTPKYEAYFLPIEDELIFPRMFPKTKKFTFNVKLGCFTIICSILLLEFSIL